MVNSRTVRVTPSMWNHSLSQTIDADAADGTSDAIYADAEVATEGAIDAEAKLGTSDA